MADFDEIIEQIDEKIVPDNNRRLITGRKLNDVLKAIISAVNGKKQDTLTEQQMQNIEAVPNKVDKVTGKGLSTNDFTDAEKQKVDTALQPSALNPYRTAQAQDLIDQTLTGMVNEKYTKPSAGIPKTDLAAGVQASLGKADSAYQKPSAGIPLTDLANGVQTEINKVSTMQQQLTELDADKADKDGYYASLGAGYADNLAGKLENVPSEFLRRPTAATKSIAGNKATFKKIKGNTIVWNQLAANGGTPSIAGGWVQNNGTLTNGLFTATAAGGYVGTSLFSLVTGHKYYTSGLIKTSAEAGKIAVYAATVSRDYGYNIASSTFQRVSKIFSAIANSSVRVYVRDYRTSDWDAIEIQSVMCIDLTLMFGAGNEPATVAEFEALFPLDYYEYNAGELLSFNGTGIKTDGFNQLDVTHPYMIGHGLDVDGSITNNVNFNIYKIQAFPNRNYFLRYTQVYAGASTVTIIAYDTNGELINIAFRAIQNVAGDYSSQFTTPEGTAYLLVSARNSHENFCINLSHSGIRNGEYEPYWSRTKALDLSNFDVTYTAADGTSKVEGGLKRAGDAYDEQLVNKDIRRIGVVDLGSLNWSLNNVEGHRYFYVNNFLTHYTNASLLNLLTTKYTTESWSILYNNRDKAIAFQKNSASVIMLAISDSAYSDAASFKAAMAGVLLFYELATPVETDVVGRLMDYDVDDWGTETILPEGVDASGVPYTAPIIADITYGLNAVDTLRNLPADFQSQESMDDLLSALGTALGFTWSKSYSGGKYNYTITVNTPSE